MPTGAGDAVLVLNAGSSSIKAALLSPDGACLWRDQRPWDPAAADDDERAPERVLATWLAPALDDHAGDLRLVGHRVVHGGERFVAPTRLDAEALQAIEALVPLAPLHNGPALVAMRWLSRRRPELPQWACFDTAFHATLPKAAHTYAVPAAWRRQGLRRFGFHGLNHEHVSQVVTRGQGERPATAPLRLISAHLGAGCSLCAVRGGRSIDTTMGFTPMEGLVMATRSGSIDPGLLLHQLRQGMAEQELDRALNSASGLLGLSELSSSMKELREAATDGHAGARLAIEVFRHALLQGIGAMAASLRGVDVIALTGGIGEHDRQLRSELAEALGWLRPFELIVVPADEEGLIARSCLRASAGDQTEQT
jgi:acetate kinase